MKIKKTAAILAATGLLTALALPALADTEIYGSLRDSTAWTQAVIPHQGGTNAQFVLGNDPTSRLGVKVSTGNFFANVELGIGDPGVIDTTAGPLIANLNSTGWISSGGGLTAVYTRHAYGTYKFDAGTLLIGQTWDPYTVPSEQHLNSDNSSVFYGALYDGRNPQIKFTLNNGLYIDFIRGSATNVGNFSYTDASTGGGTFLSSNVSLLSTSTKQQSIIPKIAIGYEGKLGNSTLGVGALGQTFKDNAGVTENAGMLYAHGKFVSGPFDALFNLGISENLFNMGDRKSVV